jgi:hypothetical protein
MRGDSAAIMGTDTLSHELVEHFVNDSALTGIGQYCLSRKCLHTSCIRKLREYEEKGNVGWQPSRDSKVDKPTTFKFLELHTHFLSFLQAEKKSKNTTESYRKISCKFLIFIEKLGYTYLKVVPLESIFRFFDKLRETWDAGSLRRAGSGLRSFLRFAEDGNRLIAAVPDKLLRNRTIIPILTQEEEQAIWDILQTDAVSSRGQSHYGTSALYRNKSCGYFEIRVKGYRLARRCY